MTKIKFFNAPLTRSERRALKDFIFLMELLLMTTGLMIILGLGFRMITRAYGGK